MVYCPFNNNLNIIFKITKMFTLQNIKVLLVLENSLNTIVEVWKYSNSFQDSPKEEYISEKQKPEENLGRPNRPVSAGTPWGRQNQSFRNMLRKTKHSRYFKWSDQLSGILCALCFGLVQNWNKVLCSELNK